MGEVERRANGGGKKTRLFCLSGGGLPGLDIHAGILLALQEAGIEATALAGTSAGAVAAAFDACGLSATAYAEFLRGLSDIDARRERFLWKLRAPWISWWLDPEPVKALIARFVPPDWESIEKPLQVFATDAKTFDLRVFSAVSREVGPREAVLASLSISGVFPAVRTARGLCIDGGVRANLPLPGDWMEYDELWLLVATPPVDYAKQHGLLTLLMRNVHALMRDQILDVLDLTKQRNPAMPKVVTIWPKCGGDRGALHFSHSLIDTAREQARQIIWATDQWARELAQKRIKPS